LQEKIKKIYDHKTKAEKFQLEDYCCDGMHGMMKKESMVSLNIYGKEHIKSQLLEDRMHFC